MTNREIEKTIYNELKGKNPTMDTIKSYVRVAMKSANIYTDDEISTIGGEIVCKLSKNITFCPLNTAYDYAGSQNPICKGGESE